eukprot:TRINITY_DN66736_c5_g10_i1.p1 TRINITY_DN66736_c5_g10~~TRINITY_DN66736_c5_g10_i1.p1  ORF type:complete len:974 (+),score=589.64 TRINITY_DN66736_c5_g10_i1:127-3048(+)
MMMMTTMTTKKMMMTLAAVVLALALAATATNAARTARSRRAEMLAPVNKAAPDTDGLDDESRAMLAEFWKTAQSMSMTWEEPKLFTEDDVRRELGLSKKEKLGEVELAVLRYTNIMLQEGKEEQANLKANLQDMAKFKPPQYTEAEAKMLDGMPMMAGLERLVLQNTNKALLKGEPADLVDRYNASLLAYRHSDAKTDARALFTAMHGMGTDEKAIINTLGGKDKNQIQILKETFTAVLKAKKMKYRCCKNERRRPRENAKVYATRMRKVPLGHCCLLEWIESEVSGGDKAKIMDAINAKKLQDDSKYYWSTAMALKMNKGIKHFAKWSDKHAKKGTGSSLRGLAMISKACFTAVSAANGAISDAQQYYLDRAANSKSKMAQWMFKGIYVGVTVAGSVGLKALDPKSTVSETEEGMFDLGMLIAGFGMGKVAHLAGKTAIAVKMVSKLRKSMMSMSRLAYGFKRFRGFGKSADELAAAATKLSAKAAKIRNPAAKKKLLDAARTYKRASKSARKVEGARKQAQKALDAVEAGKKAGKSAKEMSELTAAAQKQLTHFKQHTAALQNFEKAAKNMVPSGVVARTLATTARAAEAHHDKVITAQHASAYGAAVKIAQISDRINPREMAKARAAVQAEIIKVLGKPATWPKSKAVYTVKTHNRIWAHLQKLAAAAKITIKVLSEKHQDGIVRKTMNAFTTAVKLDRIRTKPLHIKPESVKGGEKAAVSGTMRARMRHFTFKLVVRMGMRNAMNLKVPKNSKTRALQGSDATYMLERCSGVLHHFDSAIFGKSHLVNTNKNAKTVGSMVKTVGPRMVKTLEGAMTMVNFHQQMFASRVTIKDENGKASKVAATFSEMYSIFVSKFPDSPSLNTIVPRFPGPLFGLYFIKQTPLATFGFEKDDLSLKVAQPKLFKVSFPAGGENFRQLALAMFRKHFVKKSTTTKKPTQANNNNKNNQKKPAVPQQQRRTPAIKPQQKK